MHIYVFNAYINVNTHIRKCVHTSTHITHKHWWQQMTGKVIAFLNEKGGCGKTTTSVMVAVMLAEMGYKVELINLDDQGSAKVWADTRFEVRPDTATFRVSTMGTNVQKELGGAKNSHDYIIIDGVPKASKLTIAGIKAADIMVIPVQTSQLDSWATESTVEFAKEIHELRDKQYPIVRFLQTRVLKNSKESHVFADELYEGYGFKALKSRTTQKMAYQRIFEGGGSILDLDEHDPIRHEIKMIAKELVELSETIDE